MRMPTIRAEKSGAGRYAKIQKLDATNLSMTTTQDLSSQQGLQQGCARWSNRILILAVLGIAYLTLFPFDFRLDNPHPPYGSPLLLGDSVKVVRAMDFFLNVLLF